MFYNSQIKKGGLVAQKTMNEKTNDFIEEIVSMNEVMIHLTDTVCLEDGFNLRDFFLLVRSNIALFTAITGCPFLEDIIAEGFQPFVKDENKSGIMKLQLKRRLVAEIIEEEKFLNLYTDFYGVGEKDIYAIEFSPINELTLYPIVLDDKLDIEQDYENILTGRMPFTLYDVVKGIIDELSFLGPPDLKAFTLNELKRRAEEPYIEKKCSVINANTEVELLRTDIKKPCKLCGLDTRTPTFGKPSTLCDRCYLKIKQN